MSGHSKWATIKRKKAVVDAKRGKIFTRLAREIITAARSGGGDPSANARLRTAIAAARAENMPNANIDKAIKRGTGEIDGAAYEEVTYEGYGPGGVALFVDVTTDNRNDFADGLQNGGDVTANWTVNCVNRRPPAPHPASWNWPPAACRSWRRHRPC